MTDNSSDPIPSSDSIHDGQGTYDVVLLVEQALTAADAAQVRSLHSEIEDPVVYHVLLPLEDAAARIEASLGTLGAGDLMAAPALAMNDVDIEALRRKLGVPVLHLIEHESFDEQAGSGEGVSGL